MYCIKLSTSFRLGLVMMNEPSRSFSYAVVNNNIFLITQVVNISFDPYHFMSIVLMHCKYYNSCIYR